MAWCPNVCPLCQRSIVLAHPAQTDETRFADRPRAGRRVAQHVGERRHPSHSARAKVSRSRAVDDDAAARGECVERQRGTGSPSASMPAGTCGSTDGCPPPTSRASRAGRRVRRRAVPRSCGRRRSRAAAEHAHAEIRVVERAATVDDRPGLLLRRRKPNSASRSKVDVRIGDVRRVHRLRQLRQTRRYASRARAA